MNAQIIVCFSASLAGVGIALTTCAGLMLFLSATATQNPVVTEPLKKQEPAVPGSAKPPTTFSLRKLLGAVLKTSTDLDAFCIDHFPEVSRRFSSGMERPAKEGILLETVEPEEILSALKLHDSAKLEKTPPPAHVHLTSNHRQSLPVKDGNSDECGADSRDEFYNRRPRGLSRMAWRYRGGDRDRHTTQLDSGQARLFC